ncbi:uncharacterized protein FIESC28_04080 [Fusarium coffeatum]|uniref:Uncharacterized protein n=1 Tax=Fusarium coffeatum TaxID=231269 RepID=A0A366S379_9HYPO|nr:uncharacterized protein FIESC28_04080 [Fusarium coffeatum]RBR23085.1 hypothetical protein FIESC28_04080 [Fusarium coffeatum]
MARTNNNSAKATKKKTAKAKTEESMAGGIALGWYVTGSGRSLSQAQRKAMIRPVVAIKFEDLSKDPVDRDM